MGLPRRRRLPENKTTINYKSGYVNGDKVAAAFQNGTINPFGPSAPGAWESTSLNGDGWVAKFQTIMADFKVSKEVLQLPAGMMATAFGVETRREKLDSQIQDIAQFALGSGIADSKSTSGSRGVTAAYVEADIPIFKISTLSWPRVMTAIPTLAVPSIPRSR